MKILCHLFRFHAELNVDHVMSILNDLRVSDSDWRYALRWVPARFFRNKVASAAGNFTEEEAAMYLAQR